MKWKNVIRLVLSFFLASFSRFVEPIRLNLSKFCYVNKARGLERKLFSNVPVITFVIITSKTPSCEMNFRVQRFGHNDLPVTHIILK